LKKQESNPSVKLKEDSHKNIIPTLTTKITGSSSHFSLKSLNINGLNSSIKRHRLTDWLHKQDPTFCCIQETHLRDKDRHYLRVKGWKKIFPSKWLEGTSLISHSNIEQKLLQTQSNQKRQARALHTHQR
jgi:exonuclease III